MEVTVVLHYERIEIPELDVVVSVERLSKAEFIKGSNMSPQTIVMFEIVAILWRSINLTLLFKLLKILMVRYSKLIFKLLQSS